MLATGEQLPSPLQTSSVQGLLSLAQAVPCGALHELAPSLQTAEASNTVTRVSLADAVAGFEKDLIQDALKTTRGNRAKAARLLDTTERVLNYKVKKYSLDVRRFTS